MLINRLLNNSKGFTLIELMMAMLIAAIALGAVYSVFASAHRSSTKNMVSAEVAQNLRTSIDYMEQDIRLSGLDRWGSADAGLEVATATNLRFTSDRDMDGSISDSDLNGIIEESDLERITYSYDAANNRLRQCLSEGTTNDWEVVAENVENFQFSYLDADENLIATPVAAADLPEIRTILITMTINEMAGISGPVNRTISRRILCRNLAM